MGKKVRKTRTVEKEQKCSPHKGPDCPACGGTGTVVVVDTEVYYEDE